MIIINVPDVLKILLYDITMNIQPIHVCKLQEVIFMIQYKMTYNNVKLDFIKMRRDKKIVKNVHLIQQLFKEDQLVYKNVKIYQIMVITLILIKKTLKNAKKEHFKIWIIKLSANYVHEATFKINWDKNSVKSVLLEKEHLILELYLKMNVNLHKRDNIMINIYN